MKKLLLCLFLIVFISHIKAEEQAASVIWPLTSDKQLEAAHGGQLESGNISLNGLAVNSYGGPNASVVIMLKEGGSTTWFTEEKSDRYIQFSVTAKSGNTFHANKISFNACGKGGGNMRANFYYSKDETFATRTQINYKQNADLTRDTYEDASFTIDETIQDGEKIYFRIYPYYKSATTGKYICLQNISISGTTESVAVEASATWPFTSDMKAVTSGSLLTNEMTLGNGIELYDYTTSVPTLNGTAMPGGSIGPPRTTSCAWTASETPLDDIYIQYQVAPKTGATFTITNVSLLISAFSTDKMKAAIYYSKNSDFSDKVELKSSTAMQSGALNEWVCSLNEVVATGETFYLRIYPHLTINGTWKLLNIRNLAISGSMIGATFDPAEVSAVSQVSRISTTSVIAGGTITSDGGAAVTARGTVWSTTSQPTLDNSKTTDGEGIGKFESVLTGLEAGTTYYARAYATNKAGTSYSNEITFTTLAELVIPSVQITGSSEVLNKSLIISGKVSEWGGTDVIERGVVWSNTENPTISNSKAIGGSDIGSFQVYVEGLTPEATYYFRAYATNSSGTAYSDNLPVTMQATQPDVRKTISADGNGDYTTVQEAFDAVPSNYTGRWIIHIKPGTYYERPALAKNKINVYLVGENAETTIITHDTYAGMNKPGGGTWGTSNCQTMSIDANDFMAVNITVANTFVNSKANTAINANTQAVALRTQGDRQSFVNCRITGYQDTYLGNSIGRAYFKDCYVEGNVDFIFGRQTVVFDKCTTYVNRNGSVLTAPSTEKTTKFGMVFLDCNLTAPNTSYVDFDGNTFDTFYYGRPWQQQPKSAFIRCSVPTTLNEKGWTTMNGGLSPVFVEYGCTGEGVTPERLSKRANEGKVITQEEASAYTIENVFSKDTDPSFTANWIPQDVPSDLIVSIENPITEHKVTSSCVPNPFTDKFTINYSLSNESPVDISLYDMRGQLVLNILKGKQEAGTYSIEANGSSLPSGIYFYSIKTVNGIESNKIIKK